MRVLQPSIDRDHAETLLQQQRPESDGTTAVNVAKIKRDYHVSEHKRSARHRKATDAAKTPRLDSFFRRKKQHSRAECS